MIFQCPVMIVDSTLIILHLDPEKFLVTFHCFEPDDEQCAHVMAGFLSKTKVRLWDVE